MPSLQHAGADVPLLWEQLRNCAGGMDAFSDAAELEANASARMINILVRDKLKARTRPGADVLGAALDTEPIKGLFYYDTPTAEQLVAVCDGVFRFWNGATWTEMTGYTAADARVAMAQGVDLLLVTDGTNQMRTWNGSAFSSALGNTTSDPPVEATILCWHTERMFASGKGSAPDTIWVSAFLAFGAGSWNHTNRSFRVGGGEGDPIRSMKSFVGDVLAVGKENSIWMVNTDPTVDSSSTAGFTASRVNETVTYGAGVCGPMAWDVYGNDIFFVSPDRQIRTLQRMLAASGQYQVSAPISQPVQPYIDRINAAAQSTIAVKRYQELILFAVPLDSATTPQHVLVFNGRLGRWIGVWENWSPTMWENTRFAGQQRLVFGDTVGRVNQWKDFEDDTTDATYRDNGAGYATSLWTRNFIFGDVEADKIAFNVRLRFNQGNATLTFTAVGDDADLKVWNRTFEPSGDILGTGTLPFLLQSTSPTLAASSLRDLPSFRELYLKIESQTGWWELRNLSISARQRPMKSK
jgi:hypothetical protein